ncbi:hypothetical protein CUU63_10920 [Bacillus halotolerans]|uniref:Uncharacterized protein n=1 Tax=Bacillus halotolerans TaxID=260554 RepID=A0A9Q6F1Z2_9BACI|nr:hypothetical protein CUU63_10920 [Bacillus halotolerans]
MLIESAVELLSYSSSYHLIDTNVTRTSDEIQKVSRIKKGEGRFLSFTACRKTLANQNCAPVLTNLPSDARPF